MALKKFFECCVKPKPKKKKVIQNDSHEHNTLNDARYAASNMYQPNDTYTCVRNLQEGGRGKCSLMRSNTTHKLLVIKNVAGRTSKSPNVERKGRRTPLPNEAKMLLVKLRPHPNIIRLFDTDQDPTCFGRHLLYTEYCAGGDLLDQLLIFRQIDQQVPIMFTLHVLVGLCHALAYTQHGLRYVDDRSYFKESKHEAIIHGDIKPENIFLRWPGKQECGMPDVVLADFGMAQVEAESWGITGTPDYDSPEVVEVARLVYSDDPQAFHRARNAKIMTNKSDVYQIGLVIHLMATENHFKSGEDPSNIDLSEQYRNITGFLAALVWLLQPLPRDRPECTGNLTEGFLFAVGVLRRQRDALFKECHRIHKNVWNIGDGE